MSDERRERFAALGRKGGRANAERHNAEHFQKIGRKGGARLKALVEAGKAAEE